MEDHHQEQQAAGKGHVQQDQPNGNERISEPVRSRWIPKPEQILILESIFNSGMVNPPKEETVRIRKLLEKFGSVGDANVFYWFQNRRSRARRRQRQLHATLDQQQRKNNTQQAVVGGGAPPPQLQPSAAAFPCSAFGSNNYDLVGDSSGSGAPMVDEDGFYFGCSAGQIGYPEMEHGSCAAAFGASASSLHHFQTAGMNLMMTVFINGVAAEVPRGPLDLKTMFGTQDVLLLHSSGVPLPINEFGFLAHGLQPGLQTKLSNRGAAACTFQLYNEGFFFSNFSIFINPCSLFSFYSRM